MMDNGHPFSTEPNILKEMILPPSMLTDLKRVTGISSQSNVRDNLPGNVTSNIWWRRSNVKYTTNEIYLDIVEEVDCIIDANGMMVTCEVAGKIQTNCMLSGMPDITLSFLNPMIMED